MELVDMTVTVIFFFLKERKEKQVVFTGVLAYQHA